jgi:hypothetical protein
VCKSPLVENEAGFTHEQVKFNLIYIHLVLLSVAQSTLKPDSFLAPNTTYLQCLQTCSHFSVVVDNPIGNTASNTTHKKDVNITSTVTNSVAKDNRSP